MRFGNVFWAFFWLSALLAVAHNIALQLFFYWTYLWFDIPMHFLGGVVVALGVHVLVSHMPMVRRYLRSGLVPTLTLVVFVGVMWEVYELLIDVPMTDAYLFDTALDLSMDVCGGVVGYLAARRLSRGA